MPVSGPGSGGQALSRGPTCTVGITVGECRGSLSPLRIIGTFIPGLHGAGATKQGKRKIPAASCRALSVSEAPFLCWKQNQGLCCSSRLTRAPSASQAELNPGEERAEGNVANAVLVWWHLKSGFLSHLPAVSLLSGCGAASHILPRCQSCIQREGQGCVCPTPSMTETALALRCTLQSWSPTCACQPGYSHTAVLAPEGRLTGISLRLFRRPQPKSWDTVEEKLMAPGQTAQHQLLAHPT